MSSQPVTARRNQVPDPSAALAVERFDRASRAGIAAVVGAAPRHHEPHDVVRVPAPKFLTEVTFVPTGYAEKSTITS